MYSVEQTQHQSTQRSGQRAVHSFRARASLRPSLSHRRRLLGSSRSTPSLK